MDALIGRPATEIAAAVRAKELLPSEVVRAHLDRIAASDATIGAFELVRPERALEEADDVAARDDLGELPLAGVPVAIKDNLPVAGEPLRYGSAASSADPVAEDHEVVRRLRAAGAVVVGLTRVPELQLWGTSDNVFGVARNPWDPARTAGGSSGGSGAAVAAAMVPVAIGNDGLGSIRIPSACCGLVGLKPGYGVVPSGIGATSWGGMAENGPMATTVADAALVLSVIAGRPALREPAPLERPLRIALSTRAPLPWIPVDGECAAAARRVGDVLTDAGHHVDEAAPPQAAADVVALLKRWATAPLDDVGMLAAPRLLEARHRRFLRLGRLVAAFSSVDPADRHAFRARLADFFATYDAVLTPTLATTPPPAIAWRDRGLYANLDANSRYAPFPAPWNLAGYPAMAVPAGRHSDGLPLSVQLAGTEGSEARLLALAAVLAERRPWARHAPR